MKRWHRAQHAEIKWQTRFRVGNASLPASYIHISNALGPLRTRNIPRGSKLEVGCGPYGVIEALEEGLRVGVDPLIPFYAGMPGRRESETEYVRAVGEFLPFVESAFEVVFCVNALDHMASPELASAEMARISKPQSPLMLVLNVMHRGNKVLARFFDVFDAPHPHHMTANEVQELFKKGFSDTQPMIMRGV